MTILPVIGMELNEAELLLLKPGLKLLADGLADAQRDLFPHRRPWHRIDFVSSDVYRNQAYDSSMHRLLVELHREVCKTTEFTMFRWSAIQLAAAQLALRLYTRGSRKLASKDALHALGSRIERFRKRAKRLSADVASYQRAAAVWQGFVQWMRYHLLQFQPAVVQGGSLRWLWLEQRRVLTAMMKDSIRERCYHPLPPDDIRRLVTLAKAELRRGRHPLTLKGVLDCPSSGKELLFQFVEKRRRYLLPAQGAVLSLVKRSMLREARFVAAGRRKDLARPGPIDTEQERWITAALQSCTVPLEPEAKEERSE